MDLEDSELESASIKKKENTPLIDSDNGSKIYEKTNRMHEERMDSIRRNGWIDEEISAEVYEKKLFEGKTTKSADRTQCASKVIDVDVEDTTVVSDLKGSQTMTQSKVQELINIDLVKREIRRAQKMDLEMMKREKQNFKELLQLEPRRKQTRKMQKRQKVVSKRTLELLAKKFD